MAKFFLPAFNQALIQFFYATADPAKKWHQVQQAISHEFIKTSGEGKALRRSSELKSERNSEN